MMIIGDWQVNKLVDLLRDEHSCFGHRCSSQLLMEQAADAVDYLANAFQMQCVITEQERQLARESHRGYVQMRERIEQMETALRQIGEPNTGLSWLDMGDIARRALEVK